MRAPKSTRGFAEITTNYSKNETENSNDGEIKGGYF
jgi:hypothetical protein